MDILLWLLPAVLATSVAMLAAGWVGREREDAGATAAAGEAAPEPVARGEVQGHPWEGVSVARPAPHLHEEPPPARAEAPRRTA